MQQIQFTREQMNHYMVLTGMNRLERDCYYDVLLERTRIPGMMRYEIREINGEQSLYYLLQYKTTLKQVLGNLELTYERVKMMVRSIVEVMETAKDYLLDFQDIIWDADSIFIDLSSGRLLFAYCRGWCWERKSVINLLSELMHYIDRNNQSAYLYMVDFYNLLTNPDCTMEQIQAHYKIAVQENFPAAGMIPVDSQPEEEIHHCDNMREGEVHTNSNAPRSDSAPMRKILHHKSISLKGMGCIAIIVANITVALLLFLEIWTYQYVWILIITLLMLFAFLIKNQKESDVQEQDRIMEEYMRDYSGGNYQNDSTDSEISEIKSDVAGETSILCKEENRIVVEDEPKEIYLKSMHANNPMEIHMEKNNVVIGSMQAGCDYVIKEKGISRMHAKVLKRETGLYVLDLNSTNGTYLNDVLLVSGEEYPLQLQDVVSIAQVFSFVVQEG